MGTRVPEGADGGPLENPPHRGPLETLVSRAPWAGLISTVSAARRSTPSPSGEGARLWSSVRHNLAVVAWWGLMPLDARMIRAYGGAGCCLLLGTCSSA